MSPLTTPYSGRVAGGDVGAALISLPALGTASPGRRGLKGFRPGRMTFSFQIPLFPYFRYGFGRFADLGACREGASAGSTTRSADGRAVK